MLVSVRPDGTGGHLPSWGPFISDDGRVVAFEGASDLIVGGHNSPWSEAVARDMWTGRTELVSVTLDGREPDGNSNVQGLSADGRRVLIASDVDDLVAGDTNRGPDLFVRDRVSGTTVRASVKPGGQQAKLGAGGGELSADGRVVAFTSFEGHLVRNDHNSVPTPSSASSAAPDRNAAAAAQMAAPSPSGATICSASRGRPTSPCRPRAAAARPATGRRRRRPAPRRGNRPVELVQPYLELAREELALLRRERMAVHGVDALAGHAQLRVEARAGRVADHRGAAGRDRHLRRARARREPQAPRHHQPPAAHRGPQPRPVITAR